MKPQVAIFSLTGCEGCSLAILELEDQLLDILGAVDIVNFREGMTEKAWEIDIGFVDGAVSTPEDEKEVRHYRECCKTLVAIGACACLGGINTLKHYQHHNGARHTESDGVFDGDHKPVVPEPEPDHDTPGHVAEYRRYVYGEKAEVFPTTKARPISAVVKVDYELPGCPMVKEEFLRFVRCALAGVPFRLPDTAVCVECKKRGNICLYEQGIICLGPVTRAGCDAICPAFGSKCEGCRGILGQEAIAAAGVNLREQYHVPLQQVLDDFRMFGAYQERDLP